MVARALLVGLCLCLQLVSAKKEADPNECEVCRSVISQIDASLTTKQRADVESVEKVMRSWCDTSKGKDKTMCYYMGVGDAEQGTSGGVKRDISSSLTRGINAKRLCNRLKTKDGQMCELKYDKKFDPKVADWKKLRVKELRKICDDEGLDTKGLVEKEEYVKKIKAHFNIKDEV